MTQGARAGAAAGSSAASSSLHIPANARKVVQDLQEIVKMSDDEIYAMLKECNMDPNETVQRLLNQDTFHEVKRKRDKKKENSNKELGETRARAPGMGSSMRGGRPRARGNYAPRYNPEFSSGGRGQAYGGGRDNGAQQNGKNSNMAPGVPVDSQAHIKPAVHNTNENGPMAVAAASGSATVPNGSSQYPRAVQAPRASLGPGQATMADIVKSSAANHANAATAPLKVASQQPLYPPDGSLSSTSDQVLHSYVDSLGGKQNLGTVGLERSVRDISPSMPPVEAGPASEPSEQASQIRQPGAYRLDAFTSVHDGNAVDADIPSTSAPSSLPHELISSLEVTSEGPNVQSSSVSAELPGSRASLIASVHNGRVVYQAQSQTLGSEKGSGLEWRPKSPAKAAAPFKLFNSVNEAPTRSAPSQDNMELFLNSTSKLQQLSIHDDQPVIIPDHLQVPEADRTHLSFGSFGEDFDTHSNFVDEEEDDDKKSSVSVEDSLHDEETTVEQPGVASLVSASAVSIGDGYNKQSLPSPAETLIDREDVKLNMPTPIALPVSQPEVSKPESFVQQSVQHPILSSVHGYTGSGAAPQLTSGQFTYETPETQTQEVSRASSFMSYSDPSANANYYNPVFRPSPDLDARYAQFMSASNKYSAGIPQMTGQGLSSSQEGGNSIALPTTGPAGQTSQTAGLSQTSLTIPQQHIPIQAYPSQHTGVPLTPFGANVFGIHFVPQSYGYTPPPYQHSYSGHGHTPLPQAPDIFFAPGSSYGAAAYPSTGAVPMKYAFSQYKPGGAAGNAPHTAVAAGYGNFSTSPSGFTTMNSAVTSASASGYEDANGPQYKENNLFIPSQQPGQGSGVWIQNPPSRDMAGMQTNSYYNLLGQGQHTSFAHTQPMHAVPAAAYASLYNQSQSGSAPAVHQLLQQPQALGAVGGVGTQSGAYQQQRQLNWPPNY